MLKLLRLLLSGRRPLACRIYPPGVPVPLAELKRSGTLLVVVDLD